MASWVERSIKIKQLFVVLSLCVLYDHYAVYYVQLAH